MSQSLPDIAMGEFISEAEEIIIRVNANFEKLENGSASHEVIDSIYRDIHTLKGSAQLFGFTSIGLIGHALEACLEPIRSNRLMLSQDLIEASFACVDEIEKIIKAPIDQLKNNVRVSNEIEQLIARLIDVATNGFQANFQLIRESRFLRNEFEQLIQQKKAIAETQTVSTATQASPVQFNEPMTNPDRTLASSTSNGNKTNLYSREDIEPYHSKSKSDQELWDSHQNEASTIRVQIGLLDRLMNLVGEMVLIRNQVLQFSHKSENFEFLNLSQRLDLVTSELQEDVMKTRMQPIGHILAKFNRVVRDISRELNKKIEFSVKGAETELDKSLIEAIKDPLTHIIRNSCDHGIETPEERRRNSKPEVGHLQVFAFHEGGQVIIEISDDGRGLNLPKILAKATEKGIVSADKAPLLSEREIAQLVFAPGFSTADHVSALSGRGVGMDVVKTNIEKAGGVVEITSKSGKGTQLRLRIPLTLAIVPAMIVCSGSEQFAIPQIKVQELVRVDLEGDGLKIENLQGQPVLRLRGELLPLVFINNILNLSSECITKKINQGIYNIVVLATEAGQFGMVVDDIRDTADIVVKPLPQFLKRLNAFSGATIMGDGTVSLILDVVGVAEKANIRSLQAKKKEVKIQRQFDGLNTVIDSHELLFFGLNGTGKYCLPLILVQRLEEFAFDQIDSSGKERIARYRDSILPIISLNDYFGLKPTEAQAKREKTSVIVVAKRRRLFGIEVNEIFDVAHIQSDFESPLKETPGVLGTIISDDRIATVIDVLGIIENVMEGTNSSSRKKTSGNRPVLKKNTRILFAEDTRFFVQHVEKILSDLNVELVHAQDGEAAFKVLKAAPPGSFDLILSDIEMPHMNGFELAEKVRNEPNWKQIPMIALSTRYRETDVKRGLEAGFNQYLEKLKADQLVDAIKNQIEGVGA